MNIATNQGDFSFESKHDLVEFIRHRRDEFSLDEIWVSGDEKYPCVALLTNGEYASISYFENVEGSMWLSQGDLNTEITFLAAGLEWTAPADSVIYFDTAIECIEEFCHTVSRPGRIMWQDL